MSILGSSIYIPESVGRRRISRSQLATTSYRKLFAVAITTPSWYYNKKKQVIEQGEYIFTRILEYRAGKNYSNSLEFKNFREFRAVPLHL